MKKHLAWTALFLLVAAALPAAAATTPGRWRQLGPAERGLGQILTLAADPNRPERVLAGLDGGGVARSGDGGRTWRTFSEGLRSSQISLLAVHPALGRLAYAGDGHFLHRTINDGRTWTLLPLTGVHVLALDPRNSNVVWAGRPGGLFRSADRGDTWQRIQANLPANYSVQALAVDQVDPRRIYLGTTGASGFGFWVSENGGRSWSRRTRSIPFRLFADLHAARTVYFLRGGVLQRSRDAGLTWEPFFVDGSAELPTPSPQFFAADPQDAAVFYVTAFLSDSSLRLFRTADGGRTWRLLEDGLPAGAVPTALAVAADGNPLLGARLSRGRFGVFRSEDAGATWELGSRGLIDTPVYAVTVTPGGAIFLAVPNEGVLRSLDNGANWTASLDLRDPLVIGLTADPHDAGTVYATTRFQFGREHHIVWRTTDNGETWEPLPYPPAGDGSQVFALDGMDLAVDPTDPQTLFLATQLNNAGLNAWAGIFRSRDGGETWEKVGQEGPYHEVETHPEAPERVLALSPLGLYRSVDHGDTWELTLEFDGKHALYALAVAPSDPDVVYVHQADGTLFRSTDGGASFVDLGRRMPEGGPRTMVVDPLDPNVLVFQGNDGVVRLTLGRGREVLNAGLFDRFVPLLYFDPNDPLRLLGGTTGAGLLELRFTVAPAS